MSNGAGRSGSRSAIPRVLSRGVTNSTAWVRPPLFRITGEHRGDDVLEQPSIVLAQFPCAWMPFVERQRPQFSVELLARHAESELKRLHQRDINTVFLAQDVNDLAQLVRRRRQTPFAANE